MIARVRGEHDLRWGRWGAVGPREGATDARPQRDWPRSAEASVRRYVVALVVAGAAVGVGSAAGLGAFAQAPAQPRLPATPRAWLDAYEAAAVDNPTRVCSELFARALARAYGRSVRGSCTSYFGRITSFSVDVRRVLQDGGTAVLELRQTVRPRDWAVVLSRQAGGWRAVDLLSGDLAR